MSESACGAMANSERHEAVMQTITARRRAMNLPMIIDDEQAGRREKWHS
jgi:hypothetical protein